MKIKVYYDLPQNELLHFTLVLWNTSIEIKGRKVYSHIFPSRQNILGIEFMDLSERERKTLCEHLATLGQLPKKRGMLFAGKRTTTRVKISPARGDRK